MLAEYDFKILQNLKPLKMGVLENYSKKQSNYLISIKYVKRITF